MNPEDRQQQRGPAFEKGEGFYIPPSHGESDPVISSNLFSAASEPALSTELLIRPDGTILAHNLTPRFAALLAELNPLDQQMQPRAKALAPPTLRTTDYKLRTTDHGPPTTGHPHDLSPGT